MNRIRLSVSTVILTSEIIISAVVRFLLLSRTWWDGDAGRDLTISYHILRYHEFPHLGHVSSWLSPSSFYPPLYYYLLSGIQIFSTDPVRILVIILLINVSTIFLVYKIAEMLVNRRTGLIAAALYAFSPYYLIRQVSVNSMYFSFPLFLVGVFLHVYGLKHRKYLPLCLSFIPLAMVSSIHYAGLILLPVFFFWAAVRYYKNAGRLFLILDVLLGTLYLIYTPMVLFMTRKFGILSFLSPFNPSQNIRLSLNIVSVFIATFTDLSQKLFPYFTGPLRLAFVAVSALTIAYGNKIFRFTMLYTLSFFLVTLLLASAKGQLLPPYLFYLSFVFLILTLAAGIEFTASLPVAQPFKAVLPIALTVVILASELLQIPRYVNGTEYFRPAREAGDAVAGVVTALRTSGGYHDYSFFHLTSYSVQTSNLDNAMFWYFLERRLGKLTAVDDIKYSLRWLSVNPDYEFLVCQSTEEEWCKDRFVREHSGYRYVTYLHLNPGPFSVFEYEKR